ncbi:MAG: ATP-dependent DNA helicase, partial [Mycobacteriales bacterium]
MTSAATVTTAPTVAEALGAAIAALPGGVVRSGQTQMAEAVASALESRTHLLVQAGTGTGKSLAYLVPALLSGRPVVVSTATLALQAQLLDVDLPHAIDALTPLLGRRPTAAVLKGRRNYACLLRMATGGAEDEGVLDLELPSSKLGEEVVRLREWAEHTDVGDRDDVTPAVSDRAWRQLSVSAYECIGASRCPHGVACFAERAREVARGADIVV